MCYAAPMVRVALTSPALGALLRIVPLCGALLLGCKASPGSPDGPTADGSLDLAGGDLAAASDLADLAGGPDLSPPTRPALYGRHYPQGQAAVDYLRGPEGTLRPMNPLEYRWNYYPMHATAAHPVDRAALIAYANGAHLTTARDANGYLLGDRDGDGELDGAAYGAAFHEHNARGVGGAAAGQPFTQFWFDDNWLARYVTEAYGVAPPDGLWNPSGFVRWRVLGEDVTGWAPYGSDSPDTVALDGLYYLAKGDLVQAQGRYDRLLQKSGAVYDDANQRYDYPGLKETYHLGLWKILTDKLVDRLSETGASPALIGLMVQHGVSLRSVLLGLQEQRGGAFLGWRSDPTVVESLINTESVAVAVLALSGHGRLLYEAGRAPLTSDPSYYLRPHQVLSAVVGLSKAGYMVSGPGVGLVAGAHRIEFLLRAPSPTGQVAVLDVRDAAAGAVLGQQAVGAGDMAAGNRWTRLSLRVTVPVGGKLEFRVYWPGACNLDVAYVRVVD